MLKGKRIKVLFALRKVLFVFDGNRTEDLFLSDLIKLEKFAELELNVPKILVQT